MTVIIAVRDGKNCAMAADSGTYDDDESGSYTLVGEKKIWRQGRALIGYAGGHIFQELVKASATDDPYKIRDYLQEKMKESPERTSGTVIVATPASIHVVTGEGSVLRRGVPYDAIGVAQMPALGALAVLEDEQFPVLERVKRSIAATAKHNVYVQKPYVFLTIIHQEPQ